MNCSYFQYGVNVNNSTTNIFLACTTSMLSPRFFQASVCASVMPDVVVDTAVDDASSCVEGVAAVDDAVDAGRTPLVRWYAPCLAARCRAKRRTSGVTMVKEVAAAVAEEAEEAGRVLLALALAFIVAEEGVEVPEALRLLLLLLAVVATRPAEVLFQKLVA